MISISVQQAVTHMLVHAAVIPDPPPAAPGAWSGAMSTIISWVKYGALACCLAAAAIAGGMIALGNTSRRAEMAERGKVTLICVVVAAVVIGGAGTMVTSSYGLG